MANPVLQQIDTLIKSKPVVLFMKGTPQFPQCGFSAKVASILNQFVPDFASVNVLADADMRSGIKEYSQWPTIPQLYVNGQFIGGCDIVTQLLETGELPKILAPAMGQGGAASAEPARVRPLTAVELKAKLDGGERLELYDVRTEQERAIASIAGSRLLDAAAQARLATIDRDTTLVFQCHHGMRSRNAAEHFLRQGFRNVYNLEGGIEAWSTTVDPSVPRY
jgi:Grx4 family monothiol glutaredoxin